MMTTSTKTTRTRRTTTSDPRSGRTRDRFPRTDPEQNAVPRPQDLEVKEARLRELLASYESMIVAFSGGADSAYLAWAATSVLGRSVLCVTADSPSYPDRHRQLALAVAREADLRHEIIQTSELDRVEYRANPTNRCYYCKHELYTALSAIAAERGFAVVADGSNADDRGDYRPGRQAAREFGVRSPLDDAGLTKPEIRELSRRAGLRTWDEPASACLSSRIPYHSEVTREKLRAIEHAEDVLRGLGFHVFRVRHHELAGPEGSGSTTLARLEIASEELARALDTELRARIVREIRAVGYQHVTIDLQGYRRGSLNEGLCLNPV
jgi:pyridinium-3,5-biscarboxylic acid mononucleotide sulfurtransferase